MNNLENIKETIELIDKEISKANSNIAERNRIKLKLEKLSERKEAEIEDYLINYTNSKVSYQNGYVTSIRKELEQAYKNEELNLKKESENLRKEYDLIKKEIESIKVNYIKTLKARNEELNLKIEKINLEEKGIEKQMIDFKYSFGENFMTTNNGDFNALVEKISLLRKEKDSIISDIAYINSLIKFLNDNEKINDEIEEMDLNDKLNKDEKVNEETIEPLEKTQDNDEFKIIDVESKENIPQDLIDSYRPLNSLSEERGNKVVFDTSNDLYQYVLSSAINESKDIEKIKLDPIDDSKNIQRSNTQYYLSEYYKDNYQYRGTVTLSNGEGNYIKMPNGEFLHISDLKQGLDQLEKKSRDKVFVVKDIEKEYFITSKFIKKLKSNLNGMLEIKQKKNSPDPELKKVYGYEISNQNNRSKKLKIADRIWLTSKNGQYTSRDIALGKISDYLPKLGTTSALSKKLRTLRLKLFKKNNLPKETKIEEVVNKPVIEEKVYSGNDIHVPKYIDGPLKDENSNSIQKPSEAIEQSSIGFIDINDYAPLKEESSNPIQKPSEAIEQSSIGFININDDEEIESKFKMK